MPVCVPQKVLSKDDHQVQQEGKGLVFLPFELRSCDLVEISSRWCVQYDPELSSRQFAVELTRLTNDERSVPLVVEKLINYIEMHGVYTEGIYRKSGSANKIKELKQGLDTGKSAIVKTE